jgi:hypothetical protein
MRLLLVMALSLLAAGCAGTRYVISEFGMRTKPSTFQATVVDGLNDGTIALDDSVVFGDDHCLFKTDVSTDASNIDLDLNGMVGSAGSSARLFARDGGNEPCPPQGSPLGIADINFLTAQPVSLNQPVAILSSTITLADGSVFSADGLYGKLTIVEVEPGPDPNDTGDDQVTGTFELVADNSNDPNDNRYLFLRGGIFSTTP